MGRTMSLCNPCACQLGAEGCAGRSCATGLLTDLMPLSAAATQTGASVFTVWCYLAVPRYMRQGEFLGTAVQQCRLCQHLVATKLREGMLIHST